MEFHEISPDIFGMNVFRNIGKEHMIVTASNGEKHNGMTASWGGIGVLFYRPVMFLFVRPERYTYTFLEKGAYATLSFFSPAYRAAVAYYGTHSGRVTDKERETGLTSFRTAHGGIGYREATYILGGELIYRGKLEESGFLDRSLLRHYENGGYHGVFITDVREILEHNG